MHDLVKFSQTAMEAALLAGKRIMDGLGKLDARDVEAKAASDFVTRVDRESEKLIIDTISSAFPDHSFFAEESSKADEGGYRWIIDPLDGTTNYIHGFPFFAVSIALEYSGTLMVGVVHDPLRNETFHAISGEGAFLGDAKISVSERSELSSCLVATGFPFKQKHMLPKYHELFSLVFADISGIRRAGAVALDLAYLAAGRCDGFFELGLSAWDMAAGALLIAEAGGIVTDFSGGGDFLHTGNLVAGTELTHPYILEHTRTVFKGIIDS